MNKSRIGCIKLVLVLVLAALQSCKTSDTVDLLSTAFGEDMTAYKKQHESLESKRDLVNGLWSYAGRDLEDVSIGGNRIKLPYHYPKGHLLDYSYLSIYVEAKNDARYLGFELMDVNQEETTNLLDYFKREFPEFIDKSDQDRQAYYWDLKDKNAWLFFTQGISIDQKSEKFWSSKFLYIKKGTRVDNSEDTSYNTLLDNFKMMYPGEEY